MEGSFLEYQPLDVREIKGNQLRAHLHLLLANMSLTGPIREVND